MDKTSKFLLALGLVTAGGALTGATIGGADMLEKDGLGGGIPEARHAPPEFDWDDRASLPDHYAIETPQGRFGVAELRWRGIERNRSSSAYDRALAHDMIAQDRALMEAEREYAAYVPDPRFAEVEWTRAGGQSTKAERLATREVENSAPPPTEPEQDTVEMKVKVTRPAPAVASSTVRQPPVAEIAPATTPDPAS